MSTDESGLTAGSHQESGQDEAFRSNEGAFTEALSSGLENLDDALQRQGLRSGAVVAVTCDASSVGEFVLANMVANRPAYYFTLGRSAQYVEETLTEIENVNIDHLEIIEVDRDSPLQNLRSELDALELPTNPTIIIDPINQLEKTDHTRYQILLQELKDVTAESQGLCVLYGLNEKVEPANRWYTEYFCETVLSVHHDSSNENVTDYLAIEKLYPGQYLVDEDTRVFELAHALNIDVTTSRNISP